MNEAKEEPKEKAKEEPKEKFPKGKFGKPFSIMGKREQYLKDVK